MITSAQRITIPLLVLFGVLSGLTPLATDMYLAAFPTMSVDLGTQASSIQLTLSSFMVGLALGQLLIGPLSDQWGRRPPLLIGSILCFLATVGCALAPTVSTLIAFRFVMGFTGAAGIVLSRSMITDLTTGSQTARYMNYMMMINGLSPILAPTVGGAILLLGNWRLIFWALSVVTVLMAVAVFFLAKESLPTSRRQPGGIRSVSRGITTMLNRPLFVGLLLSFVLSFGTLFSYISGSTYVLQNVLGLSPTQYSLVFALNSLGILLFSVLANTLLRWLSSQSIAHIGLLVVLAAAVGLMVLTLSGITLVPAMILLFFIAGCQGMVFGNVSTLALDQGREMAGASSALLGSAQFAMAALVSPLVGIAGDHAVLPMAIMVLVCATLALLVFRCASRSLPAPAA